MIAYEHIDARACTKLWAAMIAVHLHDATSKGNSVTRTRERETARDWLMSSNAMTVAVLAGLDSDMFHQGMLDLPKRDRKLLGILWGYEN